MGGKRFKTLPCPPRCHEGGFIYFVQMSAPGLPTKIGITQDIARRLKTIRSSSPYEVRLIAFYWDPEPLAEEAGLHDKFAEDRLRGEWFRFTEDVAEMVRSVRSFGALHSPYPGKGICAAIMAAIDQGFPP